MSTEANSSPLVRIAERLLAIVGVVNCVAIPLLFAQNQSPLFPLPGLYLIEIALVGVIGLTATIREPAKDSRWGVAPWLAAGILLAFVVLGAWSIGFFLIPATIAFLGVGFLLDQRLNRPIVSDIGLFLIAAAVQAVIMLVALMFS